MNIAAKIKQKREKLKMTLADAAGKIGVSPQYWCQVESGVKEPSIDQLIRMAKAVKLTVKVSVHENT